MQKQLSILTAKKSIEEIRQAVIEEFVKTDPKMTNIATGKEAIEKEKRSSGSSYSRKSKSII